MPMPIVIDTDMATDDWMALLYLLAVPEVRVEAVTVVGTGEAHPRPGERNLRRLLGMVGALHVPTAYGRPDPLQGEGRWPLLIRVSIDLMLLVRCPPVEGNPPELDAVDLLRRTVTEAADPVSVLALGPLTNIAEFATKHPADYARLKQVVVMGGAVDVPGNISPAGFSQLNNHAAEWNIYCDPYAAAVVFAGPVPVTLVPLDVTNRVPLDDVFLTRAERLKGSGSTGDFVWRAMQRIKPAIKRGEYYFWDPLAAVLLVHPDLGTYESLGLRVVGEPGPRSGSTYRSDDGAVVQVCTGVDAARFQSIFLDALGGSNGL